MNKGFISKNQTRNYCIEAMKLKKLSFALCASLSLIGMQALGSIYASGGVEKNVANSTDVTHTFLEDGIFTLLKEQELRILLVGGGGGGGRDCAGGGGAGGFVEIQSVTLPADTYSVVIGQGGAGGSSSSSRGGSGTSTKIIASDGTVLYEAFGGGGGGGWNAGQGIDGASGGGGANNGADGLGIEEQGHAGGAASAHKGNAPSGGGGAGGPGYSATGGKHSKSGDGGPGKASDITGEEIYYAGGGGGGSYSGTPGAGGIGGGGSGIPEQSFNVALTFWNDYAGKDGLGGGGGGGNNTFFDGAEGGSGVAIFRVPGVDEAAPEPSVALKGIELSNFSAKLPVQLLSVGTGATENKISIELQLSGDLDDFSEEGFKKEPYAVLTDVSNDVVFTIKDLAPNHTYYVRLVAKNDGGYSFATSVLTFKTNDLDEPLFTSELGYQEPGLLQYYYSGVSSTFTFDEYSEGLVLVPGVVMAGVGGSTKSVYGLKYTDSEGNIWTFASHKSYGYVGYMWMDAGSTYNFYEIMGDSFRMEIDGVETHNDSGTHWETVTYSSYECVETGWHRIRVWLGGSGGNAGNCAGGWSHAFGYNKDGDTECISKPGGSWTMLENTSSSTFLWPFKPGRTINIDSYVQSADDSSKLTFSVSLGETTASSEVWAVYGDTYEGEATNEWDNITYVGTYSQSSCDLTYDIPSDAAYVRFFAVHDWGVTSWSSTTLIDLSKTSILGLGVNHAGDQGDFTVRVNSVGEGDITVALHLSKNADMSDAVVIPIEDATEVGTFTLTQALEASTTYYYNFVAETTEGGYDATSVTSFTTLGASSFDVAPSVSVNNRSIVYSGLIKRGAGQTILTIWGGDTQDSLAPKETLVINETEGTYEVRATFPELPHDVYTKLVISNIGAGGTIWSIESAVNKNTTVDAVGYTLRNDLEETELNWNDPNIWNHSNPSDGIVTGFPSNGSCNVYLQKDIKARVQIDGSYPFDDMLLGNGKNCDIVFWGDNPDEDIISGDIYGGNISGSNISFENMKIKEQDRIDYGIGDSEAVGAVVRFANNAVVNFNGGEQAVRGTNSTLIVESGAIFTHVGSGSLQLRGEGEAFVVSNATARIGNIYVGNTVPQEQISMRIAGDSPLVEITEGVLSDFYITENNNKVECQMHAEFTVLFQLPSTGYNVDIPLFSKTTKANLFGARVTEGSTAGFAVAVDDSALRSADSKSYATYLVAWKPGINVDNVRLVQGKNSTLSYTYGWDAETNQPAGLLEPAVEGELPTGIWLEANSASGFMIIVK